MAATLKGVKMGMWCAAKWADYTTNGMNKQANKSKEGTKRICFVLSHVPKAEVSSLASGL